MVIGIDFDNTVVCYDEVFHRTARGWGLIPVNVPTGKGMVRDYLRERGREDDWTRLQGHVYGATILEAPAFPGVLEFLAACRDRRMAVHIISHKTLRPVLGEPRDLHRAAHEWLEARGFYDTARTGLSREDVHFELTKEAKLARIGRVGCTHFVGDLPEFLLDPGFPVGVRRILFDPNGGHVGPADLDRAASWSEIGDLVLRAGSASR
ncbi:MAG TPA: hypothetical protein DDZ42_02600 [Candidatus Rokubacteria bacterium]|nr:hypothetical protein [Candidatus Rokubacteria bacterium]